MCIEPIQVDNELSNFYIAKIVMYQRCYVVSRIIELPLDNQIVPKKLIVQNIINVLLVMRGRDFRKMNNEGMGTCFF
ncbi:Uncharacterised protein [uncultured archaeon]|nr:Uncharacterised protein [uncultured archaeon]